MTTSLDGTMTQDLDLSRPKIVNHLIKGAIFGVLGYHLGLYALDCSAPWNYLLGIIVWLLGAGLLRNVTALVSLPRLELRPDAIRLRYWKPTRFPSWAMFLPYNRIVDAVIPWSEYDGCRTRKFSGGDPWDWWERLYIDTRYRSHEIGWDVFARSVSRLMSEINAYREGQFRSPGQATAAVADFNSERFARPVQLRWTQRRTSGFDIGCGIFMAIFLVPLMLVMFGAIGVLVMLAFSFLGPLALKYIGLTDLADKLEGLRLMDDVAIGGSKAPLAVVIGAVLGVVFLIGMVLRYWLQDRAKARTRFLRLEADGLALGRKPEALRVIPWPDVLGAQVTTLTTRTYYKSGAHSDSTTTQLEVQVRDRSPIILTNEYGRSLSELSELIAPPAVKVALARAYMAQGTDIETAAISAGLPSA